MDELTHDPLTGLPGRAGFHAALAAALARPGASVGIFLIDLDDFQSLKKTLGDTVADAVLKSVATRLSAEVAEAGMVARTDDDEFALLLNDLDAGGVREWGQTVRGLIRRPDPATGTGLRITASIGAAFAPDDATQAWELIHCADVAQFCARSSGRDRALASKPSLRTQIERSVRDCVAAGNFSLHYQPIVALADPARLAGLEGFLRWRHPTRGLIFPGDFRPVLEEPRAARAIGSAALAEAVGQLRRWIDARLDVGRVSLNVSAVRLRDGDLADEVLGLLARRGVPPDRLALELPEDIYLTPDLGPVRACLERLRGAGVRLAVDGWAQGELSFDELARLPIGELKLDRAVVQSAGGDELARIVARAASAGVEVTAEGVETVEQRDRLAALGCARAQGWLIGRPMAAGKVAAFAAKLAGNGERLAA